MRQKLLAADSQGVEEHSALGSASVDGDESTKSSLQTQGLNLPLSNSVRCAYHMASSKDTPISRHAVEHKFDSWPELRPTKMGYNYALPLKGAHDLPQTQVEQLSSSQCRSISRTLARSLPWHGDTVGAAPETWLLRTSPAPTNLPLRTWVLRWLQTSDFAGLPFRYKARLLPGNGQRMTPVIPTLAGCSDKRSTRRPSRLWPSAWRHCTGAKLHHLNFQRLPPGRSNEFGHFTPAVSDLSRQVTPSLEHVRGRVTVGSTTVSKA